MAPPIRTRSSFPLSQSLPSESFQSLLSFSIRGQTESKPQSQKTHQTDHMDHSCLTQWNYEPCSVGPPKTDGSWWRVLTKYGPLEKGMANHFSFLALRTPWTDEKAKWYDTDRGTPQVGRCPICYWRTVEKYLQKGWSDGAKAKTTPSCGCHWWWK